MKGEMKILNKQVKFFKVFRFDVVISRSIVPLRSGVIVCHQREVVDVRNQISEMLWWKGLPISKITSNWLSHHTIDTIKTNKSKCEKQATQTKNQLTLYDKRMKRNSESGTKVFEKHTGMTKMNSLWLSCSLFAKSIKKNIKCSPKWGISKYSASNTNPSNCCWLEQKEWKSKKLHSKVDLFVWFVRKKNKTNREKVSRRKKIRSWNERWNVHTFVNKSVD